MARWPNCHDPYMVRGPVGKPYRCGECEPCQVIKSTQRIVLAECNPPFSHASTSLVSMWNKVLLDNPCEWVNYEKTGGEGI